MAAHKPRDNVRYGLVPFLTDAQFVDVAETQHGMTAFGTLALYQAIAPC